MAALISFPSHPKPPQRAVHSEAAASERSASERSCAASAAFRALRVPRCLEKSHGNSGENNGKTWCIYIYIDRCLHIYTQLSGGKYVYIYTHIYIYIILEKTFYGKKTWRKTIEQPLEKTLIINQTLLVKIIITMN